MPLSIKDIRTFDAMELHLATTGHLQRKWNLSSEQERILLSTKHKSIAKRRSMSDTARLKLQKLFDQHIYHRLSRVNALGTIDSPSRRGFLEEMVTMESWDQCTAILAAEELARWRKRSSVVEIGDLFFDASNVCSPWTEGFDECLLEDLCCLK